MRLNLIFEQMAPWGPLLTLIVQFLKESIAVCRNKNSFSCSQEPATGVRSEGGESSPQSGIPFL